jgi:anti-sigma B factor antagonist
MISGDRKTAQEAREGVDDLARNRREHILPYDRITIENANEMRQLILEAVRCQSGRAVADMSEITYMDTSCLASLLESLWQAHQQGKATALQGVQDQPRYLFEVTELDHLFEMNGKATP